jgi:hypothetical protein
MTSRGQFIRGEFVRLSMSYRPNRICNALSKVREPEYSYYSLIVHSCYIKFSGWRRNMMHPK